MSTLNEYTRYGVNYEGEPLIQERDKTKEWPLATTLDNGEPGNLHTVYLTYAQLHEIQTRLSNLEKTQHSLLDMVNNLYDFIQNTFKSLFADFPRKD